MSYHDGSVSRTQLLTTTDGNRETGHPVQVLRRLARPMGLLMLLLLTGFVNRAKAQGLGPSAPTKEYIYFGGLLVAVEERGPGGGMTPMTGAASATNTSSTGAINSPAVSTFSFDSTTAIVLAVTQPPQPQLPVTKPPTGSAGPLAATPPETHTTAPR